MSAPAVSRPATVTGAAAVTALPGAALTVLGLIEVYEALFGHPLSRPMAATLAAIYLFFGLGVVWVARGLLGCHAWARTPSLMTQLLFGGMAYWMFQGGYDLAAVLSIAYGLSGIVLLFAPGSHKVLTR